MNKFDTAWLIGLIEGEGSFGIPMNVFGKKKPQIRAGLSFKISLADCNKDLIYTIRELVGFGNIAYKSKKHWVKLGINANSQYEYRVDSINDCEKLVKIINPKLFKSCKKKDYLLWIEALNIFKEYNHLTKNGLIKLSYLRDNINSKIKKKNYKNSDYFKKIIKSRPQLFTKKRIAFRMNNSKKIRINSVNGFVSNNFTKYAVELGKR